jgi:cupin fold WbuC family metalloprotein
MIIDTKLLNEISVKAKENQRLRINYNLHDSLDAPSQRLLNGMEPGTVLPIHRHEKTAETYIVLRGHLVVTLYDNEHKTIEIDDLDPAHGNFGVNIPANTWHKVEVIESGTVIFECKDGPYIPLNANNVWVK